MSNLQLSLPGLWALIAEVVPKDLVTEVAVKLKELNYGPNIVQFHGASFIDEQRALLVFELVQVLPVWMGPDCCRCVVCWSSSWFRIRLHGWTGMFDVQLGWMLYPFHVVEPVLLGQMAALWACVRYGVSPAIS